LRGERVDIGGRIDDQRFSRGGVTQKICENRHIAYLYLFQKHAVPF
jgi:hypothetical protein